MHGMIVIIPRHAGMLAEKASTESFGRVGEMTFTSETDALRIRRRNHFRRVGEMTWTYVQEVSESVDGIIYQR